MSDHSAESCEVSELVTPDAADLAPAPNLEVDPRLMKVFGAPVPSAELRIWTAMPPQQRDKLLKRIAALDRYCGTPDTPKEEGLTAKKAASDGGLTLGRFYQIARVWPEKRSLASLGSFAAVTGPRQRYDPDVVNALQATVFKVVKANKGKAVSISEQARMLGEQSGLPADKLPKANTLRMFIEREQRRLREAQLAGLEVLFECVATSLPRHDGGWHTLFLVIDAGTRLVLGHAIGDPSDSATGYRTAASDAFHRILGPLSPRSIWAATFVRCELVPGLDVQAIELLTTDLAKELGGRAPQIVGAGTYGRYARKHLGLKLGPIQLIPGRTAVPPSDREDVRNALTPADADGRVELAVVDHNAAILAAFNLHGEDVPPGELVRLLEMMADA